MKITWGWLLAWVWILACTALAQETTDVDRLVGQLDAPAFAERQEASRKLSEAGKSVFPELEKSALAGTREVATRAVEILRQHFTGGDDVTRQAAKDSLDRLAKSGNPTASQRAAYALNPPAAATIPPQAIAGINPALVPLMQQRGLQIQVAGGLVPNVVNRTSVRTINGKREIEVQSGDKITKVKDTPAGTIEAEVTETINGKQTTRKIDAKDLEELKRKDADVAQIYERYGPRIQAGAVPGAPAVPRLPLIPTDVLKRQIESLDKQIERYKAQLPNDAQAEQRIASLKRSRDRFRGMLPKEEVSPADQLRWAAEKAVEQEAKDVAEARRAAAEQAKEAAEAARKAAEQRDPFAP